MELFIHRNGQDSGPFSPDEIQERIASGQLEESDFAWYEGAIDWMPLSKLRSIWRSDLPPTLPSRRQEQFSIVPATPVKLERIPAQALAVTKDCPFCAEPINPKAVKCKHCGEMLDPKLRAAQEAQRVAESRRGGVYVNQSVNVAAQKNNFPHLIHFFVTLFSAGFWFPIWALHYIFRDRRQYY